MEPVAYFAMNSSPKYPEPNPGPPADNAGQASSTPAPTLSSLTAAPPIPSENYELRILQSLRRIIRAIETHSQSLNQQHQVTGPQLACLLALKGEGLTITKLAQTVFLSPSTVVGIVDRLIDKGLVSRERGRQDRRQVLVALTEAGTTLIASAPSPLQQTLAAGLRQLPQSEQVGITRALETVVELMNARHIDAAPVLETGPLAPARSRRRTPPQP